MAGEDRRGVMATDEYIRRMSIDNDKMRVQLSTLKAQLAEAREEIDRLKRHNGFDGYLDGVESANHKLRAANTALTAELEKEVKEKFLIDGENQRLTLERDALREGLRKLEWFDDPNYDGSAYCVVCRRHEIGKVHNQTCWLNALIQVGEGGE
jgi:hypothetical protein